MEQVCHQREQRGCRCSSSTSSHNSRSRRILTAVQLLAATRQQEPQFVRTRRGLGSRSGFARILVCVSSANRKSIPICHGFAFGFYVVVHGIVSGSTPASSFALASGSDNASTPDNPIRFTATHIDYSNPQLSVVIPVASLVALKIAVASVMISRGDDERFECTGQPTDSIYVATTSWFDAFLFFCFVRLALVLFPFWPWVDCPSGYGSPLLRTSLVFVLLATTAILTKIQEFPVLAVSAGFVCY